MLKAQKADLGRWHQIKKTISADFRGVLKKKGLITFEEFKTQMSCEVFMIKDLITTKQKTFDKALVSIDAKFDISVDAKFDFSVDTKFDVLDNEDIILEKQPEYIDVEEIRASKEAEAF